MQRAADAGGAPLRRGLLLTILVAVTAVGPLALNIFIPSMPGMQAVFGVDYATIQLTLTLYLASTASAQLLLGPLSDRYGRRPVLLGGLLLFVLGSALAASAVNIGQLIGGRIVQAIGGSTGMVIGRSVVRDLYDRDSAASMIAYVTMAMVLAPMLAPSLGGFLDIWFGWRAGFVLVIVAGAAVLALTALKLPETHFDRSPSLGLGGMLGDFLRLLAQPAFCLYALLLSFSSVIFFAFLAGAPYVVIELMRRSPGEYGVYFALVSIGYMVGNFLAGRLSRRFGGRRLVNAGCLLALAGTSLLVLVAGAGVLTPLALFGPMSLVAVGNGMLLPNATAAAIGVLPAITGAASGLSGFLQIALGALGTWLVGALQDDTQWPMVWTMFGASVVSALALLALHLGRIDRGCGRDPV